MFPSEDVFIARAGPKLIIGETSFQNQKLLASFCPCYEQGQLGWMQRGTAAILSTDEALQSVGHYRLQAAPYTGTFEMMLPQGNNNPRLIVFDYNYSVTASTATGTTVFRDNPPLTFTAAGATFTGPGS
jgi:hypothetical protein